MSKLPLGSSEEPEENLIYLSRQFANMFGIPVRLYKNGEKIYSFSTVDFSVDPIKLCEKEVLSKEAEISYFVHNDMFLYGIVNCGEYCFAAGPVSEVKLNDTEIKKLSFALEIPKEDFPMFRLQMETLMGIHLDSLIQMMIIYNFSANGTKYDISDIRIRPDEQQNITGDMKSQEISSGFNDTIYRNNVMPYLIEKDMIRKVQNGDVEGLIDGATKIPSVGNNVHSAALLRHQKNFFIHLETIVSRAAIGAGLNAEEVINTEIKYMNKIESLDNVDRVKNLQYHMILDYADRVRQLRKYNGSNSKFVNDVTGYIRSHITESVSTEDIAKHFGKSRGRITTKFKQESGINLSDYIRLKKVQEAGELLYHTDKSLCEISNFLGFSSQSYFTKVFKDINGITPAEYRKKVK